MTSTFNETLFTTNMLGFDKHVDYEKVVDQVRNNKDVNKIRSQKNVAMYVCSAQNSKNSTVILHHFITDGNVDKAG